MKGATMKRLFLIGLALLPMPAWPGTSQITCITEGGAPVLRVEFTTDTPEVNANGL